MPIQVKNIVVEFPGIRALKGIDLEFKNGHMHAVLGANGSGKSTLVKVMTGIYKPEAGAEIIINGQSFSDIKDPNMARKRASAWYIKRLRLSIHCPLPKALQYCEAIPRQRVVVSCGKSCGDIAVNC